MTQSTKYCFLFVFLFFYIFYDSSYEILQDTVVVAIARTDGAAVTVMEVLMHVLDITAASNQGVATTAQPLTAREDTTRYLT